MKLSIFLCMLLMASVAAAQASFGASYGMYCETGQNNFRQTPDNGFIVTAGVRDHQGDSLKQINLVKLDSLGALQWARSIPRSTALWPYTSPDGNALCLVHDGGYMIASTYYTYNSTTGVIGESAFLVRTDSGGNVLWSMLYPGEGYSSAFCVQQTSDHGFIVCGRTRDSVAPTTLHNAFLFKTDSAGNLQWAKAYGYAGFNEIFHAVIETSTGDYVACGSTQTDGLLVKINASGTVLWRNTCGTTRLQSDVQELPNGDFLTIGPNPVQGRTSVYQVDANGNSVWGKRYRIATKFECWSFVQTPDGFTMASKGDNYNPVKMAHIDTSGNFVWFYEYPDANSGLRTELVRTTDGGYAFAARHQGTSALDWSVLVVKTDSMGIADCHTGLINDTVQVIAPPTSGVIISANATRTAPIVVVSTPITPVSDDTLCIITTAHEAPQHTNGLKVYPNPASDFIRIEYPPPGSAGVRIRLCDVTGKTVLAASAVDAFHVLDISGLAPGMYVLLVETGGAVIHQRVVVH